MQRGRDRVGRPSFFFLHRPSTIALRTRMCVSYHPLKATDHGHTKLLMYTHLLRKTSVIDRVKVERGGLGDRARKVAPVCLACFSTFFSPRTFFSQELEASEEKILKRNSAWKKGAGGQSRPHPYQLPTGRWMNLFVIDHEPTPYSDAHVCASCNLINAHAFAA
jgi:hypothetical protein